MDKQHGKSVRRNREPKAKMHIDSLRAALRKITLKKYQIRKLQAMMAYMDTSLKNPLPSMTD